LAPKYLSEISILRFKADRLPGWSRSPIISAPLRRKSTGMVEGAYFFFGLVLAFSSKAAWAAARRAMGTRKGEQLT
jgi:hypothetical protein